MLTYRQYQIYLLSEVLNISFTTLKERAQHLLANGADIEQLTPNEFHYLQTGLSSSQLQSQETL